MKVVYFSWLRERIGTGAEEIETTATTPAELVSELCSLSEGHALAFQDLSSVRVAIDQKMVELDTPLLDAGEVAFFPPMTGG